MPRAGPPVLLPLVACTLCRVTPGYVLSQHVVMLPAARRAHSCRATPRRSGAARAPGARTPAARGSSPPDARGAGARAQAQPPSPTHFFPGTRSRSFSRGLLPLGTLRAHVPCSPLLSHGRPSDPAQARQCAPALMSLPRPSTAACPAPPTTAAEPPLAVCLSRAAARQAGAAARTGPNCLAPAPPACAPLLLARRRLPAATRRAGAAPGARAGAKSAVPACPLAVPLRAPSGPAMKRPACRPGNNTAACRPAPVPAGAAPTPALCSALPPPREATNTFEKTVSSSARRALNYKRYLRASGGGG
jgi:hypothetical protein